MIKFVAGLIILGLFIWFIRRAWVFLVGQRKVDNAKAKLESARLDRTVLDLETKANQTRDALASREAELQSNERRTEI